MDKLAFMRSLNLFETMGPEEVEEVSRQLRMRHYAAGAQIDCTSGDRVYLLKDGRVRLYRISEDGGEVTTETLVPGQLFGLGALFGLHGDAVQAEPLDDAYICDAGASDFLAMLAKHPLLMAKVMMAMARQIFHLQTTVESMVRDPVSARLARHLFSRMSTAERTERGCLLPKESQDEMAKLIVATRESVSRTLNAWRRDGLIDLEGRRVLVLDVERLRGEAQSMTA
ncbi:MAG: Crp/Fnr family transcriptional regulator [Acidimicrobiales bacterium]